MLFLISGGTHPFLFSYLENSFPSALFVSLFITLFLFYIDEGNYNLDGLINQHEWIAVVVYTAIYTGFIYLAYSFIRKTELPFKAQLVFSVIAGLATLPFLVIIITVILEIFGVI